MNASITRPSSSALEHERVAARTATGCRSSRGSSRTRAPPRSAKRGGVVPAICLEIRHFQRSLRTTVAAESDGRCGRLLDSPRMLSTFTIAHLSDIHCGEPHFVPDLMERAIARDQRARARHRRLLRRPDDVRLQGGVRAGEGATSTGSTASRSSSIPGNHDSRNVGYVHFEDLFGDRNSVLRKGGITVVAVDSTEPDLDHGQIGRGRYRWIEEQFADAGATCGSSCSTTTCCRCPGTGPRAERRLRRRRRDRVPAARGRQPRPLGAQARAVRVALENLFVVNTGTVSSLRLRGHTRPCYNVVEVVGHARRRLAPLPVPRPGADHPVRPRDARVREVHGADRARGDDAAMSARVR